MQASPLRWSHRAIFLDDAIVEAVQTEFDLMVSGGMVVVAKHVSDVVGRDHRGVPSLVDILCKLAANWALCVCAKEIRQSGLKGWEKEGLRLGGEIDFLNAHIPLLDSPSKISAMQADLAILEAQSKEINKEWGQAFFEAVASEELFLQAYKFCIETCNIGDDELFNAALVRFRSELLRLGKNRRNVAWRKSNRFSRKCIPTNGRRTRGQIPLKPK